MTLLPRVYLQRHTHDSAPVLVHGNERDEIDDGTALAWIEILAAGLQRSHQQRFYQQPAPTTRSAESMAFLRNVLSRKSLDPIDDEQMFGLHMTWAEAKYLLSLLPQAQYENPDDGR